MVEEPAFAVEAARVAVELALAVDDAVAGDDDGDGVGAVGGTDGAGRGGVADAPCEEAVGNGFAEGDVEEVLPDELVERGAAGREGSLEHAAGAGEVLGEFVGESLDVGLRGGVILRSRVERVTGVGERAGCDALGGCGQEEVAEWGGDAQVGGHGGERV